MKDLPEKKIRGIRGSYLAKIDEDLLPVIHDSFLGERLCHDDNVGSDTDSKGHADLFQALRSGNRVIVRRDRSANDRTRRGYVGVVTFSDFGIGADGSIRLKPVEKTAEPLT